LFSNFVCEGSFVQPIQKLLILDRQQTT